MKLSKNRKINTSNNDYSKTFKKISCHMHFVDNIRPVGWILLRGVLLCFGRYFLAPEALTRAPKAQASRGVWGHAPHEILQI